MTRVQEAVDKISASLTDRSVLEIACGSAEFALAAAELAAEVTCIDLSDSRLSPAAADCENLHFYPMHAAALRFGDNTFDTAVLYNAVFHLVDDLSAAIDEALRVLRPDGVLYIISTWGLDKPVITDTLLPLLEEKRLSYRFSIDATFACVRVCAQKKEQV